MKLLFLLLFLSSCAGLKASYFVPTNYDSQCQEWQRARGNCAPKQTGN